MFRMRETVEAARTTIMAVARAKMHDEKSYMKMEVRQENRKCSEMR